MTYPEFDARWKNSGGAERANYGLFLHELCALIGVPAPNPTTDNPAEDSYVLERAVTFLDGTASDTDAGDTDSGPTSKTSTGRIDLYKRGCFVLETKQGRSGAPADTPDLQKQTDLAELGLPPEKRRKRHAQMGADDADRRGSSNSVSTSPVPVRSNPLRRWGCRRKTGLKNWPGRCRPSATSCSNRPSRSRPKRWRSSSARPPSPAPSRC